jgi:DNA polymerase IV
MSNRIIFHIDMDAFFASVEQRDTPEWRGKPVIVGARPGTRGVVSAASYEARRFGVRSAMPISEAVRRCPDGIFVRPRMEAYERDSQEVMDILGRFSPLLEQVSVDEAFLDMTGTEKLFGTPLQTAARMTECVSKELKLTASIGIAPNKFLAKIASDLDKPRGVTCAPFNQKEIEAWLAPMPVGRIWGIGKKSGEVLARKGIVTVNDLQKCTLLFLTGLFGIQGESLYALCRGQDDRPVSNGGAAKSVSREHTFNVDSKDREAWKQELFSLSQDVARRSRNMGVKGHTVVLVYRCTDFSRHSKRIPLAYPTNVAKFIYENVLVLLDQVKERALRLIGVGLTGLDGEIQTDLFAGEQTVTAIEKTEAVVDTITEKYGRDIIGKGREMGRKKMRNEERKEPV